MNDHRSIRGIAAGLVAALAAACAHAGAAPGATAMPSIETTWGELPATLCVPADAATWQALRTGATRLALEVRNHASSPRHSPTVTVRLAGHAKARRDVETLTLGIDNVDAGQPVPQRFLIDLAPVLAGVAQAPQVCVEIDVERTDAADPALAARRVTITVGWRATGSR